MGPNISAGPAAGIWLGLDTGGTFTDAVVLAEGNRIIASAKALTTPWNLAIGIGNAIRAVLRSLPQGQGRAEVSLVSVSTTLATNAVVEGRFSPVCTLLIGFDDAMVERSGIKRQGGGELVRIDGGHGATGEESMALDEAAVERAVIAHQSRVEAFAVAANFSVRNPAHELRARQIIRALSPKPVTCAHELSSKLDAPRRALTAVLNARLTPQIRHLIEALSRVLVDESIDAPLMIVKGDGSLMKAQIALEYPVETILSGPAASVVGAGFLTGVADFVVCDMGGTTTDIAVVSGGRPVVRAEGALVGGWRTMVEAVDVRTSGLGGDSEVYFDRQIRLRIGPRKAMPLSLLAQTFPNILDELRSMAELAFHPEWPAQFAFRNPDRTAPEHLSSIEHRVWQSLNLAPRQVSALVRNASGLEALRRLADAGLATIAGFTPSDAMHVLGRQSGWCREAAEYGARILATEERNARAAAAANSAEVIGGMIHISDLSWLKRFNHPSEYTKVGQHIDVMILGIDKDNRKLQLGHKQLEEDPWNALEETFSVGSVHEGLVIRKDEKGAIVQLPYGLEGFAPNRHLNKEDGKQVQADETAPFMVIEFDRNEKRIVLSHTRLWEQSKHEEKEALKKEQRADADKTRKAVKTIQSKVEKPTLGDLGALASIKEKLKQEEKDQHGANNAGGTEPTQ